MQHNAGAAGNGTASVVTGGSASTKGTPVEIFSSTSFDCYHITIIAYAYGTAGVASPGSVDILAGAATEYVLIPDLLMGYCGSNGATTGPKRWDFPLYIPAGTRIAAQSAGNRTSTAVGIQVFLHGGPGYPPFRVGSKVTTYGITTVPHGTTVPGGIAAWGAWTQIVASTTLDHFAFVPSFQCISASGTNLRDYALEMGVGAATEQTIGEAPWRWHTCLNERMTNSSVARTWPDYYDVPAGSRLSARLYNGTSSNETGGYSVVIHAMS